MPDAEPRHLAGAAWLLTDMVLNISALTVIKALGADYPAAQLVFLRASVGFVLLAPWIWARRDVFRGLDRWPMQGARVIASALALGFGFYAVARLPFALVTAIGFTRPVVMMVLAVLFLSERVGPHRWVAAGVALGGVLIAVQPGVAPWDWALGAMMLAVLSGSVAVTLTRRLAGTPILALMAFYTGGLAVLTAPLALTNWTAIETAHLAPLLAVGALAQVAQICFLRAHARAEATFLAILGYLSLILTTGVGYAVFGEVPSLAFGVGAVLIVGATLWTSLRSAPARAI